MDRSLGRPKRWAAGWVWILAAILAAGLALRLYGLNNHGLWYDEVISANIAVGSSLEQPLVPDGATFTAADFWRENNLAGVRRAVIQEDGGNASLYAVLLHSWVRVFGLKTLALRVPSLVAGTLLVLAVFGLARELWGTRAALWAAGFTAAHPLLIRYSQENRTYALATLLGVLATFCFVRLVRTEGKVPARQVLVYGLLCGAALLGHLLTVALLAAHGAYAVLRVRSRRVWAGLAAAWLIVGVVLGGWYAAGGREGLKETARRNRNYQVRAANPAPGESLALPATPRNLAVGVLQTALSLVGLVPGFLRITWLLPLLPLAAWLAAGLRFRKPGSDHPDGGLLLLLLAVSGLGLSFFLALASGHVISFQATYASFAAPFALILLGGGQSFLLERERGWRPRAALAVFGTLLAVTVLQGYGNYRVLVADQYPAVVRELAPQVRPGEMVEFGCWEAARYCNLYLPPDSPLVQRVDLTRNPREVRVLAGNTERLRISLPSF